MTKLPVLLSVPPITLSPGFFSTGNASPVIIDSSTRRSAFDDLAIDRNFFAGSHPQVIAHFHLRQRNLVFTAIGHEPRGRRGEIEQAADRVAGAAARPQFEHLAEQHQHSDHRGRFEIDAGLSVVRHRGREHAREQHDYGAVE